MSLGDDLRRAAEMGLDDALVDAAQLVVDRAIELMPEHDPVRDPNEAINLADAISIEPDPEGRTLMIVVRAPYAAKQHEAKHFDHPRGGGPKYLERALLEIVPEFPQMIASRVRARMRERVAHGKPIG